MKKYLIFVVVALLVACSSIKQSEPIISIKNDIVLHNGFDLSLTSFQHEFMINIKSGKDLRINRIDFNLKIPNYNEMWGTYIPKSVITLRPNQDYQTISFLSEDISYLNFCEQMNSMFKSKNDVFSMQIDLILFSDDGEKIQIEDLEVKINNSTLWDNIRNFVVEKGCGATALFNIKDLFK